MQTLKRRACSHTYIYLYTYTCFLFLGYLHTTYDFAQREHAEASRLQTAARTSGTEDKVPAAERMRRVDVCRGKTNAVENVLALRYFCRRVFVGLFFM